MPQVEYRSQVSVERMQEGPLKFKQANEQLIAKMSLHIQLCWISF